MGRHLTSIPQARQAEGAGTSIDEERKYCPVCRKSYSSLEGCWCCDPPSEITPRRREPKKEERAMIHFFAVAAFTTRRMLQRDCSACGHTQTVPPSKFHAAVTCERCDSVIPAPKQAA